MRTLVMGRRVAAAGIAARIVGERKTLAETDARFRPGADTACGSDGRTCLTALVVGCRRSNSAQATAAGRQCASGQPAGTYNEDSDSKCCCRGPLQSRNEPRTEAQQRSKEAVCGCGPRE